MQPVMSVQETRDYEKALAERGITADELMKRAGAIVAVQAAQLVDQGSVVVLCGTGNNGGDGWVCADHLARHGYDVSVVAAAAPATMKTEESKRAARRAQEMGIPVFVTPEAADLERLFREADVVVDACFGTGFHGELPEPYVGWLAIIDSSFEGQIVSIDVPSGLDATTGLAAGACVHADWTVTMFAVKPGLVSGIGSEASGAVVVASLVASEHGQDSVSDQTDVFVLEDRDYLDALPQPNPAQDKYTHGRVLVVAGSKRYPGAAIMAAMAAARSGAGYVTLAVPEPVVSVAQAHLLSVPVVGVEADGDGSFAPGASAQIAELATHADAVLAGPGITTSAGACSVVRTLLESDTGLVLDADGLNALVTENICPESAEKNPQALRRSAPLVLTPHRRELARLLACDPAKTASLSGAIEGSKQLAWAVGSSNFAIVAKGEATAVTTAESSLVVASGPEALATAGTGDVLAGVCAGVLSQAVAQADPEDEPFPPGLALLMAAADRIHAIAGELACDQHGSHGIVAPDVADAVGLAADELAARAEQDMLANGEDAEERLRGNLDFEDESRVEPSVEARAELHAAATAAQLGMDDEPLEEPESPERQQARLERAQRAAEVRRAKVANREAPIPSEIEISSSPSPKASEAKAAPDIEPEPAGARASKEQREKGASAGTPADSSAESSENASASSEPQTSAASAASDAGEPEGGKPADAEATTVMAPVNKESAGSDASASASAPETSNGKANESAEASAGAPEETAPAEKSEPDAEKPSGQDASESKAAEEDAQDSSGSVPPFLAQAIEGESQSSADEDEVFFESPIDPEHAALEKFHQRATKHAGVTPKIPPEERPSASRRGKSGE